jgi:hypothetical protein
VLDLWLVIECKIVVGNLSTNNKNQDAFQGATQKHQSQILSSENFIFASQLTHFTCLVHKPHIMVL